MIGDDRSFQYNPEVRGNIKVIHERKSSSAIEYQSHQPGVTVQVEKVCFGGWGWRGFAVM